jgi:hypothetical protein
MDVEAEHAGVDHVRRRRGKKFCLVEGIWRDLAAAFSTSAASNHSRQLGFHVVDAVYLGAEDGEESGEVV